MGDERRALESYENLIQDELVSKNDLDTIALIINKYRQFLKAHVPADEAARRFLAIVSKDVNVVSLLETARFHEDLGNTTEARSWYYRAYPGGLFGRWS